MKAKRTFLIDDHAKDFEIYLLLFSRTTLILAVTRSLATFELHVIS